MASETTYTCDLCGKKGKPKISAGEWRFSMGNHCVATSSGTAGAPSHPDVCQDCFDRAERVVKSVFAALLPGAAS